MTLQGENTQHITCYYSVIWIIAALFVVINIG